MPMLFLLVCSGLLGGYSVTLFKLLGELFVGKAYKTNVFLTFALLAVGLLANLLQLLFLNISMRYYDQLDVVPIFMTSYLVFSIFNKTIYRCKALSEIRLIVVLRS